MAAPPTSSTGALPLNEYRRDVAPGWIPGDPNYSLRSYLEKLRLWYRVYSGEDEVVGPLIAGRLHGAAHRIACQLKVPRPPPPNGPGGYDQGDSALARLSVEQVQDPVTGEILMEHIPSGIQHLMNALKEAFGQQDQDLATRSLDRFFLLVRGRGSLAEYSVEFDTRYEEASDRAGLQLNEVGKFYLFFKNSGLSSKQIDDIKLQVHGDYRRYSDARSLALRLSPNKPEDNVAFYQNSWDDDAWQDYDESWDAYYENWSGYGDWPGDGWQDYAYDNYDEDIGEESYFWDDEHCWYDESPV